VWHYQPADRIMSSMPRPLDPRICNVAIDAAALDGGSATPAMMNRLLALADDGEIQLIVPRGVRQEIFHPRTPVAVRDAVLPRIFTLTTGLTDNEFCVRREIRLALQGNAKPGAHDADADHLAEAAKYGGYFITNDERILRKSGELASLLPPTLTVVTLVGFLAIYDQYAKGSTP